MIIFVFGNDFICFLKVICFLFLKMISFFFESDLSLFLKMILFDVAPSFQNTPTSEVFQ